MLHSLWQKFHLRCLDELTCAVNDSPKEVYTFLEIASSTEIASSYLLAMTNGQIDQARSPSPRTLSPSQREMSNGQRGDYKSKAPIYAKP
jgi:hypothetical protein